MLTSGHGLAGHVFGTAVRPTTERGPKQKAIDAVVRNLGFGTGFVARNTDENRSRYRSAAGQQTLRLVKEEYVTLSGPEQGLIPTTMAHAERRMSSP
jgi:hypothetical protein